MIRAQTNVYINKRIFYVTTKENRNSPNVEMVFNLVDNTRKKENITYIVYNFV